MTNIVATVATNTTQNFPSGTVAQYYHFTLLASTGAVVATYSTPDLSTTSATFTNVSPDTYRVWCWLVTSNGNSNTVEGTVTVPVPTPTALSVPATLTVSLS